MRARHYLGLLLLACLCLPTIATIGADSLAERRARVEKMTASEKEQLRRAQQQFGNLSREEQDKLHELDEQLASDPNADALRALMDRYYEWVRTEPPWVQTELLELSPQQRLKRVEELKREQCDEDDRGPGGGSYSRNGWLRGNNSRVPGPGRWLPEEIQNEDATELVDWLRRVANESGNADELRTFVADRNGMDRERPRPLPDNKETDPERRESGILHGVFPSPAKDFDYDSPMARRYLQEARSKLSPEAAQFMEGQDPRRQWFWISALIVRHHMRERAGEDRGFAARPGPGGNQGPPPLIADEDLAKYLESLEKSEKDGDKERLNHLLNLPPSQMEEQLIWSYLNLPSSRMWEHGSWTGGGRNSGRGGPGGSRGGMGRGGDGSRGGFRDDGGPPRSRPGDGRFDGRPPMRERPDGRPLEARPTPRTDGGSTTTEPAAEPSNGPGES